MAKGNLFLGTARNKIGDVVLMRRNGEQVSRVRVRQIANPRTDAQTLSRLALNSATKTAQQLRGIIDHSFQGIKYGQTSVNHFTSRLTREIRSFMEDALADPSVAPFGTAPVLPYVAGGVGAAARALISSGDLTGLECRIPATPNGAIQIGPVGAMSVVESDFVAVTIANFEQVFGIPVTDQLTFVVGVPVALDYISETELFYGVRFAFKRVNFLQDVVSSTSVFIVNDDGDVVFNPAVIDSSRSSAGVLSFTFEVDASANVNVFNIAPELIGDSGEFSHAAVITSRYEAGAWRRSTTRLILTSETIQQTAAAYESNYGYNDIQSCIELSVPSQKVTEDKYLNKEPNA